MTTDCEICLLPLPRIRSLTSVSGCSICSDATATPRLHRGCLAKWTVNQFLKGIDPTCPRCRSSLGRHVVPFRLQTGEILDIPTWGNATIFDLQLAIEAYMGAPAESVQITFAYGANGRLQNHLVLRAFPLSYRAHAAAELDGSVYCPDAPGYLLCALSGCLATDPVRCPHGTLFHRPTLERYLRDDRYASTTSSTTRGSRSRSGGRRMRNPITNQRLVLPLPADEWVRSGVEHWLRVAGHRLPTAPPSTPPDDVNDPRSFEIVLGRGSVFTINDGTLMDDRESLLRKVRGHERMVLHGDGPVHFRGLVLEAGIPLWKYVNNLGGGGHRQGGISSGSIYTDANGDGDGDDDVMRFHLPSFPIAAPPVAQPIEIVEIYIDDMILGCLVILSIAVAFILSILSYFRV